MRKFLYYYALPLLSGLIFIFGVFSNLDNFPSWKVWASFALLALQVIILEIEFFQMKSGHPKLVYKDDWVEYKKITTKTTGLYGLLNDLPDYDTQTYPSSDIMSIEYANPNDLLENRVVGIYIANEPKNRNKYSVAEDVIAHITFFTPTGEFKVDGRWWHKDSPLYPQKGEVDLHKLRKTTISPPDPERLVIAYKVKDGNLFYPFGYNTYFEMGKQRQEGNLGRGNIKFQVVLEGLNLNPMPPLKFVLDGSYDKITIKEDVS